MANPELPTRDEVEKGLTYLWESLNSDRELLDDEQPHTPEELGELPDFNKGEMVLWEAENDKLLNAFKVMRWLDRFVREEMNETGEFDVSSEPRDPIDEVEAYRG